MNIKVRCGILAFTICLVLGTVVPVTIGSLGEDPNSIRQRLRQAVENAKKSEEKDKFKELKFKNIFEALGADKGLPVYRELLPDFVSFLKEKDPRLQAIGAKGLYLLRSPDSKEALFEYLKGKDFARMKEMVLANKMDPEQGAWLGLALCAAIKTVGNLGDKSAIPLLETIRQKADLELIWGYSPVEEALAELGAVKILSSLPAGADEGQIRRAKDAIQKIRNPNLVPELMTIVRNKAPASSFAPAALYALGEIGSPGVAEFLLEVVNDANYPENLRSLSAVLAGKIKDPVVEKTLLNYVENRGSSIRPYAFVGLVLCMPDKYVRRSFKTIMDPNEDAEFRKRLAGGLHLYSRNLLMGCREELYNCLNAVDKDGHPIDEIRILMWRWINENFGELPSIVLSSRSSLGLSTLKSIIQDNLRQRWHNEPWNEPSIEELDKMTEEKFKSIVTFLPEDSEVKR